MLCSLQTVLTILAVTPVALGHTWVEQLRNVNDKGQYVGEYGYPRGMFGKTDPGYDGFKMNWEIPAYQGSKVFIDNSTLLCHPSQRQQTQSQAKYPRLKAVPGGYIAMRYMENGHVTKPNNQKGKPAHAGTVFVYGTAQPQTNEKMVDVLRWTKDGKGGNGRGTLLATNNFDDGRCYEVNNTPEQLQRAKEFPNYAMGQADTGPGTFPLFCETSVKLPNNTAMGKPYTIYWLWQWPTAPGNVDPDYPNGKDEYYSTCIDVDVASANVMMAADAEPKFALGQQDAMSHAVADFASRTAAMTDALEGEVGPIFGGDKQSAAPSSPAGTMPSPPSQASSMPVVPTLTPQPGVAPTSNVAGDGHVVTVTDTIYVTKTVSFDSQPTLCMVTSIRTDSSINNSSAPPPPPPQASVTNKSSVPAVPSGPAASSQLPGFNMGYPRGAKFRPMF
ncbi:hypothetical protein ACEQ8H_003431 [Pleosporales sp. CAS-2024a]